MHKPYRVERKMLVYRILLQNMSIYSCAFCFSWTSEERIYNGKDKLLGFK